MGSKIEWELVTRSGKLLERAVWAGVRKGGIKLSAGFWKEAKIAEQKIEYVLVKKSDQHQAILFIFLTPDVLKFQQIQNPLMDGVYTLNADGGGKARGLKAVGGIVNVQSLIRHTEWLRVVAADKLIQRRRYIPERGDGPNEWILRMTPGFIYETAAHSCEVPYGIKGIYCYVGADDKVLYIGQGVIRSRFMRHAWEKQIPAKKFLWTPIENEIARKNAEDYHLNDHVRRCGELPEWNRTPARTKKKVKPSKRKGKDRP